MVEENSNGPERVEPESAKDASADVEGGQSHPLSERRRNRAEFTGSTGDRMGTSWKSPRESRGRSLALPQMLWLGVRSVGDRAGALLTPFLGLLLAAALGTGIMAYADGRGELLLREELRNEGAFGVPRSSILVIGDGDGAALAGGDIFEPLTAAVGAEPVLAVSSATTMPLLPDPDSLAEGALAGALAAGYLDGLRVHARLIEGRWPDAEAEGVLEAAMHTVGLDALGLLVGDEIRLRLPTEAGLTPRFVNVRITGRWLAREPDSPFWFFDLLDTFGATLMVDPAVFRALVVGGAGVASEAWYAQFPLTAFATGSVPAQIEELQALQIPGQLLPDDLRVVESPLQPLQRAEERRRELEGLLLLIALPVAGALLYFVVMAVRLGAEDRASALSTLRSRGAGDLHIFVFLLADFFVLGAVVAMVAPFAGLQVARLIHLTYGFLVFGPRAEIDFQVAPAQFAVAGVAMVAAVAMATLAAYRASSRSAVIHRARIAREWRRPLWQRYYVDVAMLAGAGYLLLRFTWLERSSGDGGGADPLTLLAPVLAIAGLGLLSTRLLPAVLGGAGWLLDRARAGSEELAVRHLARGIGTHRAGFVLVSVTVAMGFFLASAAGSINLNEELRTRHEYGADLLLVEGRPPGAPAQLGPGLGETGDGAPASRSPYANFPVDLHLNAPGVEDAARLWRGEALLVGPTIQPVTVYGVFPDEFGRVAWWRDEFTGESFEQLLGILRMGNAAVISSDLLTEGGHALGAGLNLRFGPAGDGSGGPPFTELQVTIAGEADLFPTHAPDVGSFVILNLRRLMLELGERPWDVLVRQAPDADLAAILEGFADEGLPVLAAYDVDGELERLRSDPRRVGVFGVLSVGFAWILLLALVLFAYQAVLTYRRRRAQVGILRATGMSSLQLARWLATENSLTGALAVVAGLGIGAVTSATFLIMLEVAVGGAARAPAFEAVIAWERALQFARVALAAMVMGIAVSFAAARRVNLQKAVQLSEEQY